MSIREVSRRYGLPWHYLMGMTRRWSDLVAWLLGLTDRFAAAVCHAGVTNLVGQYASDVTQGRERALGADVWTDPDQVLRWSPTVHLADAVTPTLVIHGEKDYRVVLTQGLELYGILQAKGVPARLLYYPDENHWILKRANSLRWYEEFAGWLERFLGA
jgi:dipeptidyl aminopeptidase/acylaminoacyl peptidase